MAFVRSCETKQYKLSSFCVIAKAKDYRWYKCRKKVWNISLKRGEQKNGIANYSEKFCWNGVCLSVQGWSRLLDKQHLINRALKLASYGNSLQGWLLGPFRCSFGCLPNRRVFVLLDALMKMARVACIIGITWIAFSKWYVWKASHCEME